VEGVIFSNGGERILKGFREKQKESIKEGLRRAQEKNKEGEKSKRTRIDQIREPRGTRHLLVGGGKFQREKGLALHLCRGEGCKNEREWRGGKPRSNALGRGGGKFHPDKKKSKLPRRHPFNPEKGGGVH